MKDAIFVGGGDVSAVLICDDTTAEVAFYPGGDTAHYQIGPDLGTELLRTVSSHFAAHGARLRVIQYRGDLAPITIGDLAAFGVPILPAP